MTHWPVPAAVSRYFFTAALVSYVAALRI